MNRIHLAYELLPQGHWHIGSGLTANGYADRLVLRDRRGLPYLPGSSLKGSVRYATMRVAERLGLRCCQSDQAVAMGQKLPCETDPCVLCGLFGSPLTPGTLRFGDARFAEESSQDHRFDPTWFETRHGVQICRRRRVAQDRHLYLLEFGRGQGEALTGQITGMLADENPFEMTIPPRLYVLLCGLTLTDRVGGSQSRGAGSIHLSLKELRVNGEDRLAAWNTGLQQESGDYLAALSEGEGAR